MNTFADFFSGFNWTGMLNFFLSALAVLLCITVHETSHGLAAYLLGDPTAKGEGRLSLNPLKHLDPLGALMLFTVGVGWAKPVSVDPRYFRNPKWGMALTALAGPVSNFLLSLAALFLGSALVKTGLVEKDFFLMFFFLLCHMAVRSLGLGLFNLIPISPLDGSKVLLAFLPEKVYWTILRYERYIFLVVIALSFLGAFNGILNRGIWAVLGLFCRFTGLPLETVLYGNYIFRVLG